MGPQGGKIVLPWFDPESIQDSDDSPARLRKRRVLHKQRVPDQICLCGLGKCPKIICLKENSLSNVG
jgi:hypothetical protein